MPEMNYSKLLCKMREKGHTQKSLAAAIGTSESTISQKFSNRYDFRQEEIVKICEELAIEPHEIGDCFFTPKRIINWSVNELIRRHIECTGQRQLAVAERAGIEPYVFFEMMKGNRVIYADELFPIVCAAGMDPAKLFDTFSDSGWCFLPNEAYEVGKAYLKFEVPCKNMIRRALDIEELPEEVQP